MLLSSDRKEIIEFLYDTRSLFSPDAVEIKFNPEEGHLFVINPYSDSDLEETNSVKFEIHRDGEYRSLSIPSVLADAYLIHEASSHVKTLRRMTKRIYSTLKFYEELVNEED